MSSTVRQIVNSSNAARLSTAPYNQAVKVNDLVFLSGVLGLDKTTCRLVPGGVEEETRQVLNNMKNILEAAGSGLDKLIKTTIMLDDMDNFAVVNNIYKEFVQQEYPARSTFQVGKLPAGARVEVEAIAVCGNVKTEIISL